MAYKIKPPYKEDNMNIPVYRRNLDDGSIGKSNHTGIIVQGGLDKEMEKAVVAHETVHQHQQRNGELDYDENNFYWKGKTYPRENLNEHNENLPWEKEAYEKSNDMLNKDNKMKKGFKLDGYRGNKTNKFSELSSRSLIGSQDGGSMKDSYMDEGPSASMCMMGGDDPTKPSRRSIRRCKGDRSSYDAVQGKKIKNKNVKKKKNKPAKFLYTTESLDIKSAPKTIKTQPDGQIISRTWDSKGLTSPTIEIKNTRNVSDDTKKQIANTRLESTQKHIAKGISELNKGGQTFTTGGKSLQSSEGSRYKKVKRKGKTQYKNISNYNLSSDRGDGKGELIYTKRGGKVKSITSDKKRFDKKVKKVVGKTRKNASYRGSDVKFIEKNMKKIL